MQEKSLPTRERELKLCFKEWQEMAEKVAPYTGAWIEIAIWISE